MAGRNSKPDNDGPAASPDRLDQFGDKLADESGTKPMKASSKKGNKC
ncbi:hypothetical protein [Paenibacillus spongiae]|uniref:Uncharacterized protein n=1 Tax=Paenibacillus spongiae TaxID=2909671 RepID=A0ABY5S3V5_9BACL|nr:hypothetical protein [Paenibacillus spongiae]UVI28584.1 hypothetical protein L1F29_24500 [Paenibacillus spongiae]